MKYAVSELVKEVKVLLDRNREGDGLLAPTDADTLTQDEIIRSKMVDAASMVLMDAPRNLVGGDICVYTSKAEGNEDDKGNVVWASLYNAYVGTIKLPDNLLRLLSVRVSSWVRPAGIISESDDAYKMQRSRYGVRGNPERPVAAIINVGGERHMELYTSNNNDSTVNVSYVAIPSVTDNDELKIPRILKDAVVYMAGYLTCVSLGDTETANGLLAVARKLAHIETTEES